MLCQIVHNATQSHQNSQCGNRSCPPFQNDDILPCFLSPSFFYVQMVCIIEDRREGKGRRCRLVGPNSFSSMPHYRFSARLIWRNELTENLTLCPNKCFGKWMICQFTRVTQHQTTTLPKWDALPKTFLQIILAAKWLVGHSSTSPKQQWRPLPTLQS